MSKTDPAMRAAKAISHHLCGSLVDGDLTSVADIIRNEMKCDRMRAMIKYLAEYRRCDSACDCWVCVEIRDLLAVDNA